MLLLFELRLLLDLVRNLCWNVLAVGDRQTAVVVQFTCAALPNQRRLTSPRSGTLASVYLGFVSLTKTDGIWG
jgi:hypothetical protein